MTNHSVMGVAQWPLSKTYAPTPAIISEKDISTMFVFIFVPPVIFIVNLMLISLSVRNYIKIPYIFMCVRSSIQVVYRR